jgi:hypothetical protein
MAFAADGKGLVPAEGGAHDLKVGMVEGGMHAFEDSDGRRGSGELTAEVRVGIEHDPGGVHLASHVSDLLDAFGYDRIRVVLVKLLYG